MPRSEDTGTAEPMASEAELLLVELLYGELDGDDARAARARIEADTDLAAELAALESLRGVWSHMSDEEPPAAVTSKLVHAASADGPRSAVPATGLWAALKRWFAATRSHPGVYAFATLILIAGVAGAIYVSGDGDVADQPMVGSAAPEPARPEMPAVPGTGAAADRAGEPAPEVPPAAPAAPAEGQVGYWAEPDEATADEPAADEPRPADQGKQPAFRGGGVASGKDQERAGNQPTATGATKTTGATETTGPTGPSRGTGGSRSTGSKKDEAPAVETTAVAGDTLDIGTAEPELKEEAEAPAKNADRDSDQVRELHRKATAAAKRTDCPEALRLGQQIRELDGRYYDTDFLADPAIKACRTKTPSSY